MTEIRYKPRLAERFDFEEDGWDWFDEFDDSDYVPVDQVKIIHQPDPFHTSLVEQYSVKVTPRSKNADWVLYELLDVAKIASALDLSLDELFRYALISTDAFWLAVEVIGEGCFVLFARDVDSTKRDYHTESEWRSDMGWVRDPNRLGWIELIDDVDVV